MSVARVMRDVFGLDPLPEVMLMSQSRLSPRDMSVFVVLLQLGSILMSVACVINTKGHVDVYGVCYFL